MFKKRKIVLLLAISLISLSFLLADGKEVKASWVEDCEWIYRGTLYKCIINPDGQWCLPGGGFGYRDCSDNSTCWGNTGTPYNNVYENSCTGAGWCNNVPPPPPGHRCHYMYEWKCDEDPKWTWVDGTTCSDVGEPDCCTSNCDNSGDYCIGDPYLGNCGQICWGTGDCVVNGVCSTPDHTWNLCSTPTLLCSAGTESSVNGTGTPDWWWKCAGYNGGSTAKCWAAKNICGDGQVACGEQCDLGTGNNGSWPKTCSLSCTTNICPTNCSCAADTCVDKTCPDGCGGLCSGTKQPRCDEDYKYCEGVSYIGTCEKQCFGKVPNNWGGWNDCSRSCGVGTQTRVSTCLGIGGTIDKQTQNCNSQPCPPGYREVAP
jgi:hypothetical protein